MKIAQIAQLLEHNAETLKTAAAENESLRQQVADLSTQVDCYKLAALAHSKGVYLEEPLEVVAQKLASLPTEKRASIQNGLDMRGNDNLYDAYSTSSGNAGGSTPYEGQASSRSIAALDAFATFG